MSEIEEVCPGDIANERIYIPIDNEPQVWLSGYPKTDENGNLYLEIKTLRKKVYISDGDVVSLGSPGGEKVRVRYQE